MNLKTPITFSETGKVKNNMKYKDLILQSTKSLLASRLIKISSLVVLVNFHFHTKYFLQNINKNQAIMCSI